MTFESQHSWPARRPLPAGVAVKRLTLQVSSLAGPWQPHCQWAQLGRLRVGLRAQLLPES